MAKQRIYKKLPSLVPTLGCAVLLGLSSSVHAVDLTSTWAGGSGNWNNAANWDTSAFPNNTGSNFYTAIIDSDAGTSSVVTSTSFVTIDALVINAGDLLQFNNDIDILVVQDNSRINSGKITNNGQIKQNSTGNFNDFRLSGLVSFSGNGQFTMGGNPNNRMTGGSGGIDIVTNGAGHTINGGGNIGVDSMGLVNQGLVDANMTGVVLNMDPGDEGFVNQNVMQASNQGILRLLRGNFDNTVGTIQALDNSIVQLDTGARVDGGTLTTQGTGIIEVRNDQDPILAGAINNTGTLLMNSTGNFTDMRIDDAVTLSGAGRVTLGGNTNNRIFGLSGGDDVLTNAADHTIDGGGQLGANALGIVNEGTIDANIDGKTLFVDPNALGVQNNGVMQASNGGILRLNAGDFDGSGGGIMRAVDGGRLQLGTNARIVDSTFTGPATGTIEVANDFDPILAGIITNNTQVIMNSLGNFTDLRIDDTATLQGNGRLTLGGHVNNRIFGLGGGDDVLINAANHTIDGAGQLGTNGLRIVNNGTIDANDSDKILYINPDAQGVTNNGIMQASDGGILRLTDGDFDGSGGGIMRANDGGRLQLGTNARIIGGTFSGPKAGSAAGIIEVANDFDPILAGIITNNTQVIMNSLGNFTDLRIDNATTLTGTGRLTLGGHVNNRIFGLGGADDVLTNAASHTIDGAGQLGTDGLGIVNKGTIDGNDTGKILHINPDAQGVINNGIMQASDGGILRLEGGDFDGSGGGIMRANDGGRLQLGTNARIIGGTFSGPKAGSAAGIIEVANDFDPILAGIITNNTQVIMNSLGNFTDLRIDNATTLTGNGRLTLGGHINNRIFGLDGVDDVLTNDVNHTIDGGGQLGRNSLNFVNKGIIDGNKAGTVLYLDPGAGGVLNSGTLQASDDGILRLEAGDFIGGTLHAQSGGRLQLGIGARISDATFTSSGTGVIEIANDLDPIFAGTITNQTLILMNSLGNFTDLRIDGSVTLNGNGRLTLNNHVNNRIFGLNGGSDILTNGINHTIEGGGQLGLNSIGLINKGTIRADVATTLTIDVDANGFVNEGTLQSSGTGGLLIAAGDFENKGTVEVSAGSQLTRTGDFLQTAGKTTVNGTLDPTGTFLLQGGELGGTGTIASNVINSAGTVSAGNSPGELTISGNYDQGALANMIVEIAGNANGDFDILSVAGIASLDGGLEVVLLNDFIPQIGDEFDILLAGTLTGAFDLNQIFFPIKGGISFDISYLIPEGIVRLTAIQSSAVPLPTAFWLFASGLIGLVCFARREV